MNEPAFPRPASPAHQHGMHKPQDGMSLRDYFAAKAMQAMLSSPNCPMDVKESALAKHAYQTADAMLKAREA